LISTWPVPLQVTQGSGPCPAGRKYDTSPVPLQSRHSISPAISSSDTTSIWRRDRTKSPWNVTSMPGLTLREIIPKTRETRVPDPASGALCRICHLNQHARLPPLRLAIRRHACERRSRHDQRIEPARQLLVVGCGEAVLDMPGIRRLSLLLRPSSRPST